jgi:hypothetical protein
VLRLLFRFATSVQVEKVHPLQSGLFRGKHPSERRPGLPPVHPLMFWPRYFAETAWKTGVMLVVMGRLMMWQWAIERHPDVHRYTDQALMPVADEEEQTLDLLTKTSGARTAIDHLKKVHDLTHQAPVAAAE